MADDGSTQGLIPSHMADRAPQPREQEIYREGW